MWKGRWETGGESLVQHPKKSGQQNVEEEEEEEEELASWHFIREKSSSEIIERETRGDGQTRPFFFLFNHKVRALFGASELLSLYIFLVLSPNKAGRLCCCCLDADFSHGPFSRGKLPPFYICWPVIVRVDSAHTAHSSIRDYIFGKDQHEPRGRPT